MGDLSEADLAAAAVRHAYGSILDLEWDLCRQVPQSPEDARWMFSVWEGGDEGALLLCYFDDNPLKAVDDAVAALALSAGDAARGLA